MSLKKVFFTLVPIYLFSFISSCTKVINIDLKDSEPKYVVEGEVNKGELNHIITITQTIKFSETNSFPKVSGAIVTLSDNVGNSEILTEISAGKYMSSTILGVEGNTYTLSIKINEKEFISISTMPYQVNLDQMTFIEASFGSDGGKVAIPIRQDPAGIKNYYRFDIAVSRFSKNEGWIRDSSIIIQDDEFSDGVITQQPIFGTIGAFMPNDTCRVSMMCIDENVYKYFYSLSLNSEGGAATPANPISNFSGGCLGYFTAQTKQTFEVVVE